MTLWPFNNFHCKVIVNLLLAKGQKTATENLLHPGLGFSGGSVNQRCFQKNILGFTNRHFSITPCFFGKSTVFAAIQDESCKSDTRIIWELSVYIAKDIGHLLCLQIAHLNRPPSSEVLPPDGIRSLCICSTKPHNSPLHFSLYCLVPLRGFISWVVE